MVPIHELIQKRFSPRKFDDRAVSRDDVRSVLEAARWAASSFNEQPWRFIVATKDNAEEYERMLGCLLEGNQSWASAAPVLMMTAAKSTFTRNDKPNRHSFHDVGLAVAQLTLQALELGLYVHQMAGIDREKTRETYSIPEGFEPVTGLAIGYLGEDAPSSRARKPHDELFFAKTWGEPY